MVTSSVYGRHAHNLFARQAEFRHAAQIRRHPGGLLVGQFGQIGPRIKASVVTVRKADTQRIAPDVFCACHADMPLACRRRRGLRAVPLGLGAGAFDAQQLVGDRPLAAIIEADQQFGTRLVEAQLGGKGGGGEQVSATSTRRCRGLRRAASRGRRCGSGRRGPRPG